MKKIIAIIITAVCLTNYSNAQDNDNSSQEKFHLGVKVGLNLSNVYDTKGDEFQTNSKLGLVGGGFISIPIGKFIGVQPEVLFSQKGFQATGIILGAPYTLTRTSNFIDVPLFFAFKPVGFLTLLVGPQFSYLIKQKDVFESSIISYDQEQEFKTQSLRKNLLSFKAGVDVNLKHIVLSARVGWDIQNNTANGLSTIPRYKNVWYQATVGIRL